MHPFQTKLCLGEIKMKRKNKILSLFLALFILFGMVPTTFASTASQSAIAAVDDDFNGLPIGLEPDGWTVEPIGRPDAGVKIVAAPKKAQGDNAMRIEDNSTEYANPTRVTKTFASAADVELCFDYYLESVSGANALGICKDGIATNQKRVNLGIFPNGDGTATLKYYNPQTKWVATAKKDMQKETWYSFKIVSKANSDTADVYVNGEKIGSVWADQRIATVDRIVFHTNNKASKDDVFLIDNVKVIGPAVVRDYPVVACNSGKFGFTATLSHLSNLKFALLSGDAYGIYITASRRRRLHQSRNEHRCGFARRTPR